MKERFFRGLSKVKGKFIFAMVLWLLISLLFISPIAVAIKDTMEVGNFNLAVFFPKAVENFTGLFSTLGKSFSGEYIGTYWSCLWKFSLFYLTAMALGLIRAVPKSEFGDIEHGSSDWSEHGEQYETLSSKKGIILAEKNYLPIDKRGNVNVLVVGRFRFW